jgi:hypothetical protein
MRASSSTSSDAAASFDDASETESPSRRGSWIGVISVLGYCAICGLVYLLH